MLFVGIFNYIAMFLLGFVFSILCISNTLATAENKDWSYFVFAQQWPPAACLQVPHGKCLIPKVVSDWSIHGLWPTSHKGYPSFCNASWHFNPVVLKPLLLQMEAKWPNIFADSTEISFWKHEWMKHGTCAGSLESFDSEYKYFKNSLILHDNLNVFEFLRKSGIYPRDDQPQMLDYIEKGINLYINGTVKLFCRNHKGYNYPLLSSMYICLDLDLNVIGCDEIKEPTCKHTYVYYLPFSNQTQLLSKQKYKTINYSIDL